MTPEQFEKKLKALFKRHKMPEDGVYMDEYRDCLKPCCYEYARRDEKFAKAFHRFAEKEDINGYWLCAGIGNVSSIESYVEHYKMLICEHEFVPKGLPSRLSTGVTGQYYECNKCGKAGGYR